MRCYCTILGIHCSDHVTKEEVRRKIQQVRGPRDDLLTIVKKRKLKWYGHVCCSTGLSKTVLQGTVRGSCGKTAKEVGGQHPRMDKYELCRIPESGGGQRQMEERGGYVFIGAFNDISRGHGIIDEVEEENNR